MRPFRRSVAAVLAATLLFALPLGSQASGPAEESPGLVGWGKDAEYNRLYKPTELDELKGTVQEITEITPIPGMAPGVGLTVKDQDGEAIPVHLGPKTFVKLDALGVKRGDKVKAKGAWTQLGGKEVFMASKIKKGDGAELKVRRTKDGTPFWTLSPEDLAKEKE